MSFEWFSKLQKWQQVVIIISVVIILCGMFCPRGYRSPAMYAKFGLGLGPIRGNIGIEAFKNADLSGLTIVLFYAPWCGHCKKLMPEFDEFAKEKKGDKKIKIIKVDCVENTKMAKKYGIESFPTIKCLKDGKQVSEYTGERTKLALKKWFEEIKASFN